MTCHAQRRASDAARIADRAIATAPPGRARLAMSIAACAACLVAPRLASGQAVGYQLDRFEPAPAGDPFAVVELPWYAAAPRLVVGLTLAYANDLLVAEQRDASGNVTRAPSPIEHHQGAHFDLAASFTDRFAVTASVPLVLHRSGTAFAGLGPSGASPGDPRIGARVRLFGAPDASLSVSGVGYVWIPIGAERDLAGDASVRAMARLTAGGHMRASLRWAVNASFLARQTARLAATVSPEGNTVGSELQFAAGVGYLARGGKLAIGPEAILSVAVGSDLPAGQRDATVELFATSRYALSDRVAVAIGLGTSAAGAPGPPDARVLLSLSYAPDLTRRASSLERVVVVPDENGHVGSVEVSDGARTTVLDKAYAATEIGGARGGTLREVQSSPQAVAAQTAPLAQALPPVDRDHDGIADALDACPERAGSAQADPIRHGCPASAEKVVVLPDADGHVGAIEVGDGTSKTIVDTAYGSVEVAADGGVRAVPPVPPRALDRAIAQVAHTLPAPDADADGLADADDACPDRAGVASPDPVRHGCPPAAERIVVVPDPDGSVGAVEVDDGRTKLVVDKPYAAVEVAHDGTAQLVAPVPAKHVERAIASVASALPIADSDQDGIRDEADACPDRGGAASADSLRHGCPPASEKIVVLPDESGHVGAVEIDDGTSKVVLDAPYASAEVSGGAARTVAAAPPFVVTRATEAVARGLPPPDRDDDGVVDRDDACPDRAGSASVQPIRNGCPPAVEQIVVLPDEHGVVGAVEVDDGTSKIVLDRAYATADVGADGRARSLAAEPSEVSARFGAAMAARPPGARIVLYFTARSEPVRDLTGPIDNLVAELKAKATYSIEVIGHTDQTGSERANVRIGLERARLIADRLVAAGVPADRIRAASKGSREPAVKAKNRRTVELRNRRVEVWVR